MDDLNRLTVEEFKQAPKWPYVVVLDNVRSIYNVGSMMRTSDAFRCSSMYLCGITVRPPHKDLMKTALGAENTIDWKYFSNTMEAIAALKDQGFFVIAIEQTYTSKSLSDIDFYSDRPIAFVFGNEVDGVAEDVLQHCDMCIEIPQFGSKHSFNVSVTCGMILWEYAKQHNKASNPYTNE
jgi:23S rRNA (guanosine2251-2'-O)-methyltransferase